MILEAQLDGQRLDVFLSEQVEALSRNAAQKLIAQGAVTRNGLPVSKNDKTKLGDQYTLILPEPEPLELVPENIPLDIRWEDADCLVINKPRGLVVHPAPGHSGGTLVNALLYHCELSGINGTLRPGIVHRIDMDTSGLLIVAKTDFAHQALSAQLQDHTLHRVYECVVCGGMKEDQGTIDAPIGRNPKDRKKMAVVADGREARTHYMVLARYRGYSHLSCQLETGRTHQIRVHMAYVGHPIVGDPLYGHPALGMDVQCLHARRLCFRHPRTGEEIQVEAPLPEDFCRVLQKLKP